MAMASTATSTGSLPVKRSRLPMWVEVAGLLRRSIADGGLAAGDPLPSEADLAGQFGVSLRVVREALRKLTNQGLVETRQGKRAVVTGLRPVAIEDYFRFAVDGDNTAYGELLELRLALESQAAALAAERADANHLARLHAIMNRLAQADMPDRVTLDLEFHGAIAAASGNRFFSAMLEALREVLAAERRAGGERIEAAGLDHRETNAQHQALLEAIAQRKPDLADQRMREIVIRAQRYFRELPRSEPRRSRRRPSD